MVWFLTLTVLAVPFLFVWYSLIAILTRPFGVRLPLLAIPLVHLRQAIGQLSFRQYIIVQGVLVWGAGTWLMIHATNLVTSRFGFAGSSREGLDWFFVGLGVFMLAGIGFGWMMWNHLPDKDPYSAHQLPKSVR